MLDAIRPDSWINIPAPIRDAVSVQMTITNSILTNMVSISNNFKIYERESRRRENRNKENLDQIMKIIKEKVDSLREATEKNLNNVNNLLDKRIKTLNIEHDSLRDSSKQEVSTRVSAFFQSFSNDSEDEPFVVSVP